MTSDARLLDHILDIREADISALAAQFPRGARILELGGGNGYQASLIASWGCEVESIDVQPPPAGAPRFHPVQQYDGSNIPFADGSFDIVFSSAVLEHVPDPVPLLRETRRVMKADAIGIYVLPSTSWRFWTLLAHYPYLVKRALGWTRPAPTATNAVASSAAPTRSVWERVRRLLVSSAHGEYPTAVSELYYYSKTRWAKVFAKSGLQIAAVAGNGVFYTGYRNFPSVSQAPRRLLARFLGSPCHVFTVRKTTDQ